jgi:pimeloyl-ACP methyl ester carboxylesterase
MAYAPDLRGCGGPGGRSQALQEDGARLTIADLAEDVYAFVVAMNVPPPTLVGHSLGGLIAIDFALAHPELLSGLVLEDTGPSSGIRLATFGEPLYRLLESRNRWLMRTALRSAGIPRRGDLARALVEDALGAVPGQYQAFSRAASRWRAAGSLSDLKLPTLLIWGRRDRIMPVIIGREYLRHLPDAEMVIIPGAGHSPHLERPKQFARALHAYLKRHSTTSQQPTPA